MKKDKMKRVVWEVDMFEDEPPLTPVEIARKARAMQLNPDAIVGNFKIYNTDKNGKPIGRATKVDLDEIDGKL